MTDLITATELCVSCGHDTSFGSGRFVNRIPSDDGYMCVECQGMKCDRCGAVTEDYWMVEELEETLCDDCLEAVKDDLEELPDGYEDDDDFEDE